MRERERERERERNRNGGEENTLWETEREREAVCALFVHHSNLNISAVFSCHLLVSSRTM